MHGKINFFHSLVFSHETASLSSLRKAIQRFYTSHLENESNGFLSLQFPYREVNNSINEMKIIIGFQFKKKASKNPILIFFLNNQQAKTFQQEKIKQFFGKTNYQKCLNSLKKNFAHFSPLDGIFLIPIAIKKPWGKEIWFSGIEKRGVSLGKNHFSQKTHAIDKLIFVFKLFGFLNQNYIKKKQPILLKILKPLADKVYGQLYYELHEKKKEVYIVSQISKKIYPQGVGKIRLGFNLAKKKNYPRAELFFQAKLKAILAYKKIRFQIDEEIEAWKAQDKHPPSQVDGIVETKKWLKSINQEKIDLEKKLRKEMEAFSAYQDLKIGDTVTIENKTPHALQAGVEAVEFQTPHYERLIISYPQKVLTQNDWDSEKAFRIMKRKINLKKNLSIEDNEEFFLEKCVDFREFKVYKIAFKKIKTYELMKIFKFHDKEMIFFNLNAKVQIAINQLNYSLPQGGAYLFPIHLVNQQKITIKNLSTDSHYCLIAF